MITIQRTSQNFQNFYWFFKEEVSWDVLCYIFAGRWNIRSELWAKKLYDFIFAYEMSENKDDVIEALKPHCFVRVVSFYRQTMEYDTSGSRREDNMYRLSKAQLYVWRCKLCWIDYFWDDQNTGIITMIFILQF